MTDPLAQARSSAPEPLQPRPRRIGLFGGSFDPVHRGHRVLADAALAQLGLDELRWVVAAQPWQKARRLASAEDRAAMVALAIADEPRHRLESCELERTGPSYSIDTVEQLQAQAARDGVAAQWFLLIGQDQYANLATWRRWPELLDRVTLAVAARDGRRPTPGEALAAHPHRIVQVAMPPVPLSSTALRAALQAGCDPLALVPDQLCAPVAQYLACRQLYHLDPAQSSDAAPEGICPRPSPP